MAKFVLSAFSDEICPELKGQMDVLEQFGIQHIEMRGVNGRNLVDHTLDEVKEIKKELNKRGFSISAVGSPIGKIKITDDFEPHLALFRHTLKIAEILDTRYIRMFSFFMPKNEDPALHRDVVMERWFRFVREAEGTGLVLLHENEKDIYGDTPERCLDLMETMGSRQVKATFDPANFVQCDVETYPAAYNLLKNHITYMHIKDALYADHSVTPSGQGDGKVYEILKALYEEGYEGFLSLEPHLASFEGFSALELNGKIAKGLSGDGEKKFAVAVDALKTILKRIEV